MDSYPWEPAQTTSGIIKDPNLGKRVVPPTVRKDGRSVPSPILQFSLSDSSPRSTANAKNSASEKATSRLKTESPINPAESLNPNE